MHPHPDAPFVVIIDEGSTYHGVRTRAMRANAKTLDRHRLEAVVRTCVEQEHDHDRQEVRRALGSETKILLVYDGARRPEAKRDEAARRFERNQQERQAEGALRCGTYRDELERSVANRTRPHQVSRGRLRDREQEH